MYGICGFCFASVVGELKEQIVEKGGRELFLRMNQKLKTPGDGKDFFR